MKKAPLFVLFLLLSSGFASAHTELSKPAIGFIYLPGFHKDRPSHQMKSGDYDPSAIPKGVALQGAMGSVPLVAFDYVQLKSTHLGSKKNNMAYVFEQRVNRYQLRTDESQFLWVGKEDTTGYISFEEVLLDSCVYLDITSAKDIEVTDNLNSEPVPVRNWSEVIDQRYFQVTELQDVDGALWMRVAPKWTEQWHGNSGIKKSDKVFETNRWMAAHNANGLTTLQIFGMGKNCS